MKMDHLVFTEWGVELPFLLQDWGKFPVTIHTIRDRSLGIDGEFREVFVQQKPYEYDCHEILQRTDPAPNNC